MALDRANTENHMRDGLDHLRIQLQEPLNKSEIMPRLW